MRLTILITAGFVMANQADVRRMVDTLLALQQTDDSRIAPRIVPRAPDPRLEGDDVKREQTRQNILNDPFMQHWLEYRREYEDRPAPYGNPQLKGPLPGQRPADEVPYEDPWTGPALAPKRR